MAPIYEFDCPKEHTSEVITSVRDKPVRIVCLKCGLWATPIISRPVIQADIEAYVDENLCDTSGEAFVVKGRAHKRQRLKDLGLEVRDPSPARRAKDKERANRARKVN